MLIKIITSVCCTGEASPLRTGKGAGAFRSTSCTGLWTFVLHKGHTEQVSNFGTAGAFITRRDRTDIKTLEDMRGKTFAANYESAFHGYRIGIAELVKHGYDPKKFFRRRILSESQRINCWTKLFRAGRKLPSSGPAGLKNTSTKTLQCSTKSKL